MARIDFDDRPLGALLREPALVLDYDVIFHLAANAYIPPSVENPAFDFALNLETTFRLLEVLRTAERRPRLVNTSSAAVYGDPQRLPIHESDPTVPISPYGVGKLRPSATSPSTASSTGSPPRRCASSRSTDPDSASRSSTT